MSRACHGACPRCCSPGATSGLGRHLAFELVRTGHTVLAHGRDEDRTRRLVEELRAEGDAVGHRDVREGGFTPRHTVADGAPGVIALATRDLGSGRYFDGTRPARAHEAAYDPEVRRRLATVTDQLLRT